MWRVARRWWSSIPACNYRVPGECTSVLPMELMKNRGYLQNCHSWKYWDFFPRIWVSFCRKRQKKYDGVHYVISSTMCSINLVKILIFQVDICDHRYENMFSVQNQNFTGEGLQYSQQPRMLVFVTIVLIFR